MFAAHTPAVQSFASATTSVIKSLFLAIALFSCTPLVNAQNTSPAASERSNANQTQIPTTQPHTSSSPSPSATPQAPIIIPAEPPQNASPHPNQSQTSSPQPITAKPITPISPTVPASPPAAGSSQTITTTTSVTTTVPEQGTQYEKQKAIQDFVRQAANYIIANGKETALKEFNLKEGAFTKGTLYIFAIDFKGTILASPHANDPKMIGSNQLNFKDSDGVPAVQLLIQKAKAGGGWTKFKWENPVTKKVECKNTYSMPADSDYLIASGYFYAPNAAGKCED